MATHDIDLLIGKYAYTAFRYSVARPDVSSARLYFWADDDADAWRKLANESPINAAGEEFGPYVYLRRSRG